jgi:hypothetical protein
MPLKPAVAEDILMDGIVRPKDWETPNRLAAAERENREMEQGIQALVASGVPEKKAYGEYFRRLQRWEGPS